MAGLPGRLLQHPLQPLYLIMGNVVPADPEQWKM
jgi:hypothetical protein